MEICRRSVLAANMAGDKLLRDTHHWRGTGGKVPGLRRQYEYVHGP